MRSIMSVKDELLRSTTLTDYDVITITETWLNEGHNNNEYISNKYQVFRKDRHQTNINAKRGGGILIAVLMEIDCEEHTIPEMKDLEAVCVRFPLKRDIYLYIVCMFNQTQVWTYTWHILMQLVHSKFQMTTL